MNVTETIAIGAPREQVWSVLVDIPSWPSWTASVRTARLLTPGPLGVGSRVRLHQPRLPKATWEVTELTEPSSFTWTSHSPGLRSVAEHIVTDTDGSTRLTLLLRQSGVLAGVANLFYGKLAAAYVSAEANGLKRRCESGL